MEDKRARIHSLSLPRSLPRASFPQQLLVNFALLVIHPAVVQQKAYFHAVHVDAVAVRVRTVDEGAKHTRSITCAPICKCGSLHLTRVPHDEEEWPG
jgi:hypothetical protein